MCKELRQTGLLKVVIYKDAAELEEAKQRNANSERTEEAKDNLEADKAAAAKDAAERITVKCSHARAICDDCLAKYVEGEVRSKGNYRTITCPAVDCNAVMEHHEVQRWAIASVFEQYDQLLLRDHLQQQQEFRWCAWPGCGYGQLHRDKDAEPIMECFKCRRKT